MVQWKNCELRRVNSKPQIASRKFQVSKSKAVLKQVFVSFPDSPLDPGIWILKLGTYKILIIS